jgi:hypothetical protein
MKVRAARILATLAGICIPVAPAAAQAYDAVSGFNGTNGSGPWSYLQRSGSTTTLLTTPFSVCGLAGGPSGFGTADPFSIPAVYFNTAPDPVECLSVGLAANAGFFHPGTGFSQAIVRFTAPSAGQYAIAASYWAGDKNASGFGVSLEQQGYDALLGTTTEYSLTGTPNGTFDVLRTLALGETIDLVVSAQPTGNFFSATTGFRFTLNRSELPVTPVPEPGTVLLSVVGVVALGLNAQRRRRSRHTLPTR